MFKIKFILVPFLILLYSCNSVDLSSPEKNIDTFYKSVVTKNFDMYEKCFYMNQNYYTPEIIKLASKKLFNDVELINYRIIQKKKINENEVNITVVEETIVDKEIQMHVKSKYIATLIKIGNQWKILKSETLEFKPRVEEERKN